MTSNIELGRAMILGIIALILGLSLAANIGIFVLASSERLAQQIVQIALTVLLSYYLYTGAPLARWIAIVLHGFAGIMIFFQVIFTSIDLMTFSGILILVMGMVYLVISGLLLFSAPVKAFFSQTSPSGV